jgi:hypothetical protein
MCLSKRTGWYKKKEGVGWKVFKIRDGHLYSEYQGGKRKIGKWLTDKRKTSILTPSFRYPAGWHIFPSQKDARQWSGIHFGIKEDGYVIRKVNFKNVACSGKQLRTCGVIPLKVIVAKKMYIIPLKKPLKTSKKRRKL